MFIKDKDEDLIIYHFFVSSVLNDLITSIENSDINNSEGAITPNEISNDNINFVNEEAKDYIEQNYIETGNCMEDYCVNKINDFNRDSNIIMIVESESYNNDLINENIQITGNQNEIGQINNDIETGYANNFYSQRNVRIDDTSDKIKYDQYDRTSQVTIEEDKPSETDYGLLLQQSQVSDMNIPFNSSVATIETKEISYIFKEVSNIDVKCVDNNTPSKFTSNITDTYESDYNKRVEIVENKPRDYPNNSLYHYIVGQHLFRDNIQLIDSITENNDEKSACEANQILSSSTDDKTIYSTTNINIIIDKVGNQTGGFQTIDNEFITSPPEIMQHVDVSKCNQIENEDDFSEYKAKVNENDMFEYSKHGRSQIEKWWSDYKIEIEKTAEVKAKAIAKQWQKEKKSLADVIESSFKEYGELYEKAYAIKIQFEYEKNKWTNYITTLLANNNSQDLYSVLLNTDIDNVNVNSEEKRDQSIYNFSYESNHKIDRDDVVKPSSELLSKYEVTKRKSNDVKKSVSFDFSNPPIKRKKFTSPEKY